MKNNIVRAFAMALCMILALSVVPASAIAASGLTINMTRYPINITQGQSFSLEGTISFPGASFDIDGYIYDDTGSYLMQKPVRDHSNSGWLNIGNSDINYDLKFGALPAGSYWLQISINGAGKYFQHFTVSKPHCFTSCASYHNSIVDALKSIGANSSYAYRCQIAARNGIGGYRGTAAQNIEMLNRLKAGNLLRP